MPPSSGKVQLFADRDYRGASVSLDEGSYNLEQNTGAVGDDTVSSLKVASGYSVVAFKDADCNGAEVIYTGDVAYVDDSMNETISSVRVVKTSVLDREHKLQNFPPQGEIYQLQNPIDLADSDDAMTPVTFPRTFPR